MGSGEPHHGGHASAGVGRVLVECAACGRRAEFVRRKQTGPGRGGYDQALAVGWIDGGDVCGQAVWRCPECEQQRRGRVRAQGEHDGKGI
jgi:hypothetical protein